MRIKTALYNTDHLEYGIVTIPFPIPKDQYDSTIKMLEAFDIGDPRERDCMVREVLGPVPSLKCLEGTQINVDELDYGELVGISTIVAVTAAAVALLVRMISRNERAVAEATSWLKRIVVTWIVLNTLGFVVAYLQPLIQGGQYTPSTP